MVATATAAAGSTGSYPVPAQSGGGGAATVPFFFGSNWYVEKIITDSWQLTTTTQEFVHNINPGGFLRGVRVEVRATGGVGGTMNADGALTVFSNLTLENIDGSPILYPMSGYAYGLSQALYRPWLGAPWTRFDWVNGVNPAFSLLVQPEIRHTAGVLANTDARALYRIRATVNTFANVITSGSTAPTLSIAYYMEAWAQPDAHDLHGNAIEALPPGLNLSTIRRHQVFTLNGAGAGNQFQLSNTGNELRGVLMIVRDSNNARQDYLSDPIRVRLDNRSMGTFSPNEVFNQMNDFFGDLNSGAYQRPTGVYMWPRFYNPGAMIGQSWEQTTNATYLLWETNTLSTGTNLPGTVEVITDECVPVGAVPAEFESI